MKRIHPLALLDKSGRISNNPEEDWNDYLIRCEGRRIRTSLNGVEMIDYTEPDDAIPQLGLLGLQVHGGGPAEASYKDITIEELP